MISPLVFATPTMLNSNIHTPLIYKILERKFKVVYASLCFKLNLEIIRNVFVYYIGYNNRTFIIEMREVLYGKVSGHRGISGKSQNN